MGVVSQASVVSIHCPFLTRPLFGEGLLPNTKYISARGQSRLLHGLCSQIQHFVGKCNNTVYNNNSDYHATTAQTAVVRKALLLYVYF